MPKRMSMARTDHVAMRSVHRFGSRRFRSKPQYFQLGSDVDFGTSDFTIAFAMYVPGPYSGEKYVMMNGATADGVAGFRVVLSTNNSMYITLGDGTARKTVNSGNGKIVPGTWHWWVLCVDSGTSFALFGGSEGLDMETSVASATWSPLSGSIDNGAATGPQIGGSSVGTQMDKICIARLAIVKGSFWDASARDDWRNNAGVYSSLAAATKANMLHYYNMDERSGNILDSVGTNHGTEVNGPIRTSYSPWSAIVTPLLLSTLLGLKDTQAGFVERTLISTQLVSGGWWSELQIDGPGRDLYAYVVDGEAGSKRNTTTLDNGMVYEALDFLMDQDEAAELAPSGLHTAILYALDALAGVQRPNGGFPQEFDGPCVDEDWPITAVSVSTPVSHTWPPNHSFADFYTHNDAVSRLMIPLFTRAYGLYADADYLAAATAAADFCVASQLPAPQPGWAQQYNALMQPDWARPWEAPTVSVYDTQYICLELIRFYATVADADYLTAVDAAIAWLDTLPLYSDKFASYYDLEIYQPVFFNSDWEWQYTDTDMLSGYTWYCDSVLDQIKTERAAV